MNATAADTRFVQLPAQFLTSVRRVLVGEREPLEAVTLLRQVGYETSGPVFEGLVERLRRDYAGEEWGSLEPGEFWRALATLFADQGWGTVEHDELHPAVGAIRLTGWVESESEGGPRGCHLTTGFFTGLLERLAGAGVAVMEVPSDEPGRTRLLYARGDVLGEVYHGLQDGATVEEAIARLG